VHINECPGVVESSAYLLEFDSVHGRWPHKVEVKDGAIIIDEKTVTYSQHKDVRIYIRTVSTFQFVRNANKCLS
jgi:glyceraldehyde-3-phosphate dehydrogenase/erythrose-4-phosphate dehydrogenase